MGGLDTTFLLFYSAGLFVSGQLNDHFNSKKILVITYFTITTMILIICVGGYVDISNPGYFYVFYAINGAF